MRISQRRFLSNLRYSNPPNSWLPSRLPIRWLWIDRSGDIAVGNRYALWQTRGSLNEEGADTQILVNPHDRLSEQRGHRQHLNFVARPFHR